MKVQKDKVKTKLKVGDLVKIIAGKWKGTVDYIAQLKDQRVFLRKANKIVYHRKKFVRALKNMHIPLKSEKREIMIPIAISNIKKVEEKGQQQE